jgi:enamine deaminase RidA (YjgF/YER057c/UK114 family)
MRSAWRGATLFVMDRQNFPGTSPFEPIIGFSRAVRIGKVVHVSGTGPVGADDLSAAEQTRTVLRIIEAALLQAGAKFEHVYRTRMFIAHQEDWEEIGRVHGEVFGEIRPAATMVVASMLNPQVARRNRSRSRPSLSSAPASLAGVKTYPCEICCQGL